MIAFRSTLLLSIIAVLAGIVRAKKPTFAANTKYEDNGGHTIQATFHYLKKPPYETFAKQIEKARYAIGISGTTGTKWDTTSIPAFSAEVIDNEATGEAEVTASLTSSVMDAWAKYSVRAITSTDTFVTSAITFDTTIGGVQPNMIDLKPLGKELAASVDFRFSDDYRLVSLKDRPAEDNSRLKVLLEGHLPHLGEDTLGNVDASLSYAIRTLNADWINGVGPI